MAKQRGRPPAGPKGQPRRSMRRQISARLSDETYAQLKALTAVLQASQADVISLGFDALERSLGEGEQKLVTLLRKRDTK